MSGRVCYYTKLVLPNPSDYRTDLKAELLNLVRIHCISDLCFMVCWAGVLMIVFIICAGIALTILIEVLNR